MNRVATAMSRSAVHLCSGLRHYPVAGRSTVICALSRPLRRLHTAAQNPPAAGGISCGRGGEITSGPGGTTTSGPGCGKSGPFSGCGSSDGVGGRTTSGFRNGYRFSGPRICWHDAVLSSPLRELGAQPFVPATRNRNARTGFCGT
jgi:hypothetical protein